MFQDTVIFPTALKHCWGSWAWGWRMETSQVSTGFTGAEIATAYTEDNPLAWLWMNFYSGLSRVKTSPNCGQHHSVDWGWFYFISRSFTTDAKKCCDQLTWGQASWLYPPTARQRLDCSVKILLFQLWEFSQALTQGCTASFLFFFFYFFF